MKRKINKKNKNRIKIATFVIGAFIIIFMIASLLFSNKEEENREDYSSLKELFASFECTFIREEDSKMENITTDIYVTFGRDLYTNEVSNERYFIDLIQAVAKFKRYINLRLIDEKKEVNIIILGNNNRNMITRIYINGDGNYFGNHDSTNSLLKQEEEKITPMQITSTYLQNLIEQEWKRKNVYFGTRETIYKNYWYYFDEGMEIRAVAANVYNIVFRKNYKGEIIQGITTNMTQDQVISRLGKPTFGEEGSTLIGYKGEDIYLFITDSGISVYPNLDYETEEFIQVIRNITDDMTAEDLLNKVTSVWNDYDKYEYNTADYICLRYSLKGVQIQFNMENNHGIVFYNNYTGEYGEGLTKQDLQEDSSKIPNRFYFENENLVYQAELERYDEDNLIHSPEGYSGLKTQATENFYATIEKQGEIQKNLRVISKTRQYADSDVELDTQILSFLWIDQDTLAFSIKDKGIYLYHANNYTKENLLLTKQDCQITKYEDGKLYYNDTSISID